MSGETELNRDRFKAAIEELAKRDPHLPAILDVFADTGEVILEGARPHARKDKPFGMRTFTQIGPVGRSILLAVHDRLHGIDRSEDYELDKKKGVLVLKKGRT